MIPCESLDDIIVRGVCPECGNHLAIAVPMEGAGEFLVCCSLWCDHREPLPEDLRLRRMGAPAFEGME